MTIFVMHLLGKITDWIEKKVLGEGGWEERRDKRRLTDERPMGRNGERRR